MSEKLPYWGSVALSSLALVLLVADISLANANRALQIDVSQRQSAVANGQTLNQLNQGLVQALAEASIKNNNTQLRELLSSQGITLHAEQDKTDKGGDKPAPAPSK